MAARIGVALIAVGAAVFVYQIASLMGNRTELESRREVLVGSIDQEAGSKPLRPALSVVGVALVAGGIFVFVLSGGKRA